MTGAGAASQSGIVIVECGVSEKAGQILNNKHDDDTPQLTDIGNRNACRADTQWSSDSMRCPANRKETFGWVELRALPEVAKKFVMYLDKSRFTCCALQMLLRFMLLVPIPGVPMPCGLQKLQEQVF